MVSGQITAIAHISASSKRRSECVATGLSLPAIAMCPKEVYVWEHTYIHLWLYMY